MIIYGTLMSKDFRILGKRLLMDDEFVIDRRACENSFSTLFQQYQTFILYENQAVITMTVIHK